MTREQLDDMDEEATVFALYLLMPEGMFERDMAGVDLVDDEKIGKIARKYRVPVACVHYRAHLAREQARKKAA
jgi:Zn-dependent peptidase ImmA (M78 family)